MSTKVEARLTPQGKKYLCLVMGEGQFPPSISLRTAEAVVLHLEDIKRFVEKKAELCSRFGVPLPSGQAVQSESNWQGSSTGQSYNPAAAPASTPDYYPPQQAVRQHWQGSLNEKETKF